jgi:phenol hydroxylase P0 protein
MDSPPSGPVRRNPAYRDDAVPPHEAFDPGRRYVRVTGINSRGFVEFEFAVGAPELFVELMLPPAMFESFCATQNAQRLDPLPAQPGARNDH